MSDDGTGGGIRIPSMLIGQKDGDRLINWLNTASEEDMQQLTILCEFVMPYNEDDTVSYDFWYTSSSDRALSFLEDFKQMNSKLKEMAFFEPHFVFWECKDCDKSYIENDCFGGGRYCALEPSNSAIKGQEIIQEDLRQKCLWNILSATNSTDLWWEYIEKVHSMCYSVINQDCSQRAHQKLGLSWSDTQKCVRESFTGKDWISKEVYNEMIESEIKYWKEFGTTVYPSVVINKKTYRGQIEPLAVYNALCAGFKDPPPQCLKTLGREPKLSVEEAIAAKRGIDITKTEIVGICFVIILLNIVVVYCCRRRARRDMQNEMNMQIESAVSQYFALTSKNVSDQTKVGTQL